MKFIVFINFCLLGCYGYSQDSILVLKGDIDFSLDNFIAFHLQDEPDVKAIKISKYSNSEKIYEVLLSRFQGEENLHLSFYKSGSLRETFTVRSDSNAINRATCTFNENGSLYSQQYVQNDSFYRQIYFSNGRLQHETVKYYDSITKSIFNEGYEKFYYLNGNPRFITLLSEIDTTHEPGNSLELTYLIDALKIKSPFKSRYSKSGIPISIVERTSNPYIRTYKAYFDNQIVIGELHYTEFKNQGVWQAKGIWKVLDKQTFEVLQTKVFY